MPTQKDKDDDYSKRFSPQVLPFFILFAMAVVLIVERVAQACAERWKCSGMVD